MRNFTNKYQLSKTLRFELKPQGKTLENFTTKKLLEEDEDRSVNYKKIKKIIDRYHKAYIDLALKNIRLTNLDVYQNYYQKNELSDAESEAYELEIKGLRKQIVRCLTSSETDELKDMYSRLTKKELIREDLPTWLDDNEEKALVLSFSDFTTYFTGFHENRKNMYSEEEKSTAIAYRMINDNLPKFMDNMSVFEKLKQSDLDFEGINKRFEQELSGYYVEEFFTLIHFNEVLTQTGIDQYNLIIGGVSDGPGLAKRQGLNELINLYNQQQTEKSKRLPKFKFLWKQILSDTTQVSFREEAFETDTDVAQTIEEFLELLLAENGPAAKIHKLISAIKEYDLEHIYFANSPALKSVSQNLYGNWSVINEALVGHFNVNESKYFDKGKIASYDKELEKFNATPYFSLKRIIDALEHSKLDADLFADQLASMANADGANLVSAARAKYSEAQEVLTRVKGGAATINIKNEIDLAKIKAALEAVMSISHFVKPLSPNKKVGEKDVFFYSEFEPLKDELGVIISLFNKVRNFATKKPYSDEKIKLNFENSTLLAGWDVNKEKDNTSILLQKEGLYYLAILDKNHKKVFEKLPQNVEGGFQKVNYKLLPGPNKMLPKVFFAKSRIEEFGVSEEVHTSYQNGAHKKGKTFDRKQFGNVVDFFKRALDKHPDWSKFNFKFSPTSSYETIADFYNEVASAGYSITYTNVADDYINKLVEEGKIYLFQIYNKDFSPQSKGTPNMHTIYWRMLFHPDNLKDTAYKLNGSGEIFYRKQSLKLSDTAIHKANEQIKRRTSETETSQFPYDIIKDKRYTVDKFHFHVPITINFKAEGVSNLNGVANEYVQHTDDIVIIGIDRGERHLLYLSMINSKGEIVDQYSLNQMHNGVTDFDYHKKLTSIQDKRDKSRKDWSVIQNIKEMKQGYMSQVVHKVAKLMVEKGAMLVLEDLNVGFKRGRFHVEKQVYQNFEVALINKLGCYIDKSKMDKLQELGSPLKPLQLANQFQSFQKMGKQSGMIYYVPAWNTSKIDPTTGFVNLFTSNIINYKNKDHSRDFFSKFDSIHFNPSKDRFEVSFDYEKFTSRAEGTRSKWTLCVDSAKRFSYNRELNINKGGYESANAMELMADILAKHNIAYGDGADLITQITDVDEVNLYKELHRILKLVLSLRHTNGLHGVDEVDCIISPVENKSGVCFTSQNGDAILPKDADANGAYHIALKGLWVANKIKEMGKPEFLKNKEWLTYVQTRNGML